MMNLKLFYNVEIVAALVTLSRADETDEYSVEVSHTPWRVVVADVEAENPYEAVMRVVRERWSENANYFLSDEGAYFAGRGEWPRLELADGRFIGDCAVPVCYDRLLMLNGVSVLFEVERV